MAMFTHWQCSKCDRAIDYHRWPCGQTVGGGAPIVASRPSLELQQIPDQFVLLRDGQFAESIMPLPCRCIRSAEYREQVGRLPAVQIREGRPDAPQTRSVEPGQGRAQPLAG